MSAILKQHQVCFFKDKPGYFGERLRNVFQYNFPPLVNIYKTKTWKWKGFVVVVVLNFLKGIWSLLQLYRENSQVSSILLIGAVHCNTRKGCYNLSAIYMAPNKEKNSKETWRKCEVSCSTGVFLKSPTSKFQFRVYLLAKKELYRWDLQRSPTGIRIHSSYCVNKCFFL